MPNDLELLHAELKRSLNGLSELQTQLRPQMDARRWHIQQIAGHLLLTYKATITAMDAQIAKQRETEARLSPAHRVAQFAVLRLGWLPRRRTAPGPTVPDAKMSPASGEALIAALGSGIAAMDARIAAAEELFGSSHRSIRHMILGPMSLAQWRRFHLVHGRHHIRQIAAIRAEHRL